jgi:hypothetical protein
MDETKKIKIGEVEFTIGFISRRVWFAISSRMAFCFSNVKKAIEKPDEIEKLSPDEMMKANVELMNVYWDVIKHGVKDHTGLFYNDQKPVAFVKDDLGVVSDQTIELYQLNGFFNQLASEIISFNTLTEDAKKN